VQPNYLHCVVPFIFLFLELYVKARSRFQKQKKDYVVRVSRMGEFSTIVCCVYFMAYFGQWFESRVTRCVCEIAAKKLAQSIFCDHYQYLGT
jgi:hypothetical protein